MRKCALILAVTCASVLVVPVAASAKATPTSESVSSFAVVPVHGKAANGKAVHTQFALNRFITQNGTTYAVGRLTGFLGQRAIFRSGVAIPVAIQHPQASASATCPILHLVLGPLNLNLLGLHVHLNQVVLNITAVSGPGNLLGNLLCDVSNLLNNNTSLLPAQVTGLLNIANQTLATPSLLNL